MELFLNSLSQEAYSLTKSASQAEHSHFELQEEYNNLKNYTRQQLIQSSLGLHIPSLKTSKDLSNTSRSKSGIIKKPTPDLTTSHVETLSKTISTVKKSKLRFKPQKKIHNRSASVSSLRRPQKTANLSSNTNSIQNLNAQARERQNNEQPQFLKTLNINTDHHQYQPKQQKQQSSSRSKQELKFTQRSLNLNSSRLIVPSHPFVISPSLGGEGCDYQDHNHFTDIPPIQNERRKGLKKAQSPFFARVFSETANPNIPPDSPYRRPKEETIDYNIHVY
ncbi:hypothetical protein M9Y10_021607 [Tritrichomonas musculus]|uniref:Uncharacterized protein n=1 Tax=Tritrichomonas musculus TaxID=1915356 RepID=A0ABR2KQU6_9EUKA